MALKKGYKFMIAEAEAAIEAISATDLIGMHADPDVLIIDIRDIRERKRGFIPNSIHAPRGMLEFWADPDCTYHKDYFSSGKKLIFHCSLGWRSALATKTLQDMGLENIAHLDGGLKAWKEAGGALDKEA
jgi:rhodanese-related sulfurtransferase